MLRRDDQFGADRAPVGNFGPGESYLGEFERYVGVCDRERYCGDNGDPERCGEIPPFLRFRISLFCETNAALRGDNCTLGIGAAALDIGTYGT